jgi:hypothetical protein
VGTKERNWWGERGKGRRVVQKKHLLLKRNDLQMKKYHLILN